MGLTKKKCVWIENGKPFTPKEAAKYLRLVRGWKRIGNKIEKSLVLKNFKQVIRFVNKVADLAEAEGHHPDILVYSWNRVNLMTYTHSIGGLSENDFILAAKINRLIKK